MDLGCIGYSVGVVVIAVNTHIIEDDNYSRVGQLSSGSAETVQNEQNMVHGFDSCVCDSMGCIGHDALNEAADTLFWVVDH